MQSESTIPETLPSIVNVERPMTVQEINYQQALIHEVLEKCLIGPTEENPQGVHYGLVPGTSKPTLKQPGAEKICMMFRLAPKARVEDLCEPDSNRYRYRVAVGLYTIASSMFVGEAIGEASSDEEKYQWEEAVCKEQWDSLSPTERRVKYKKRKNPREGEEDFYTIMQVRRNAADIANTVLKIAFKRALVSATRGATAASDILEVDLDEDAMAALLGQEHEVERPAVQAKPKPKPRERAAPKFSFGKHKGRDITDKDIPVGDLEWMANAVKRTIDAPEKAGFKAQNILFVAALEAEIAARNSTAKTPPQEQVQEQAKQQASTPTGATESAPLMGTPTEDNRKDVNGAETAKRYMAQIEEAKSLRDCSMVLNALLTDDIISHEDQVALEILAKQRMATFGRKK